MKHRTPDFNDAVIANEATLADCDEHRQIELMRSYFFVNNTPEYSAYTIIASSTEFNLESQMARIHKNAQQTSSNCNINAQILSICFTN